MFSQKQTLSFQFVSAIRQFFTQKNFIDVLTPPMVDCPVIEPFIEPFQVQGKHLGGKDRYLHTSPEFWMKYLLSEGLENIFTISYCFRDGPVSPIHRSQFLMLEWYRAHEGYGKIRQDLEELTKFLLRSFHCNDDLVVEEMTVQELFQKNLGVDILELPGPMDFKKYIQDNHPDIPLPWCDLPWDDYYHLLFLNKLTPRLEQYRFLILKEYPAQLRALSRLKKTDPRVCERFEYFIDGIEVANCYSELTDLEEQKKCFEEFNQMRDKTGGSKMPRPEVLFHALKKGIPPAAGIALGIERLMKALLGIREPFFIEESSLEGGF